MNLMWTATFMDGEVMREQDGAHSEYDSPFHALRCLDRPLRSLGWFDGERLVAGVLIPHGAKPYVGRDHSIGVFSGKHAIERWVVGWGDGVSAEYVAVYPDGAVLVGATPEALLR